MFDRASCSTELFMVNIKHFKSTEDVFNLDLWTSHEAEINFFVSMKVFQDHR